MATYDAYMMMVQAIQRAGGLALMAPPSSAKSKDTDVVTLTQGRYYFKYGSHNPDLGD